MAAASSSVVVIKVKYEDTLRRFRAQIIDGELSLTADELRKKIVSLFEFSSGAEIVLTYIDEDGDTVTIVDSADLSDVANQCLNPIRFTVEPVSENDSRKFNPSGSFSRRRSSDLPCENDDARKFSLPEPTFETLERVIDDLISKYGIVNIADHLSIVFESVTDRALEEKHYSLRSFHPSDLPPTRERDAVRENNSSASFDPLTFLSHEHRQQHHFRFGNAKESVNTFPYPPLNTFPYPPLMSVPDRFIDPIQEDQLVFLSRLAPQERRMILGEKLYPLVEELEPRNAAKVTGIILELGHAEIMNLLEDTSALRARVDEAMKTLRRDGDQSNR